MKTGKQIQGDVYRMLRASHLVTMISGDVYCEGMRPRDSKLEDVVVIFTGGLDGEIQEGVVTINIYVPDIDPSDSGVFVVDGQRCEELEMAANAWVEALEHLTTSDYWFSSGQTVTTDEATEIGQHFVVVKLKYRLIAF